MVYDRHRMLKGPLNPFWKEMSLTVITAHSLLSIGFSKSGYRKHKAASSQETAI
jgi:hypothetical protein